MSATHGIDLNSASEHELSRLPGVSVEIARALARMRPFRNWRDVEQVPGLSQDTIDRLKTGGVQFGDPPEVSRR